MCDNVQNINAIDFAYRGTDAQVIPAFNKKIAETDCVGCGQCRVVCPTGAISIHTNIDEVWEALADQEVKGDLLRSLRLYVLQSVIILVMPKAKM